MGEKRDERLLARIAARELSGKGADRFRARADRRGLDLTELDAMSPEDKRAYADNWLEHLTTGPGPMDPAVGGKQAERLRLLMDQAVESGRVEDWASLAQTQGIDSIAQGSANLGEQLSALMNAPVDQDSASYQSVLARYTAGRQNAMQTAMNDIGMQKVNALNAIDTNFSYGIAQSLSETGALISALEMMKEEEKRLAAANRGRIFADPFASFAKVATGGRASNDTALGFSSGMWNNASFLASVFSGGMGGGGGGGGASAQGNPWQMFDFNPGGSPSYGNQTYGTY